MSGNVAAHRYPAAKPFRATRPKPPGYEFGRPSIYDPSYCQRAIDYMGQGYSLTAFAGEIGVAKDTIYNWISQRSDFSDAIQKARAARLRALETKLLSTKVGVGVTAAIFALKNADPEEWRDLYQTESKVNVMIQRLSDAELLQIAASGRSPLTIDHDAGETQQANERQAVADREK